MRPELERFLGAVRETIAAALEARLPALPPAEDPLRLREACRYAMLDGGKRLRPALTLSACEAVGGSRDAAVVAAACAVEAVHGYSLVHDDLPAMDNDDLRRGRPTVHRAFGEGCAVLCGDALLTAAFEWLAEPGLAAGREATMLRAARILAVHAGAAGMVGGQAVDLATQGTVLGLADVEGLAHLKTAALFRAAALMGGLLGGGGEEDLAALDRYATALGVAFQHRDDLSDASRPEQEAGIRARLGELCDRAAVEARRFGARGELLVALAEAIAAA